MTRFAALATLAIAAITLPFGPSAAAMLELDLDRLTNPSVARGYRWRAFVTPYGEGVPDESRTFELRSTVPLPMTLMLRGRYDRAGVQS